MTVGERFRRMCELNAMLRSFHAAAVRLRNPAATPRDVRREWLLFTLGRELMDEVAAAGHDLYRGLPEDPACEPDEPLIIEGRTDVPG